MLRLTLINLAVGIAAAALRYFAVLAVTGMAPDSIFIVALCVGSVVGNLLGPRLAARNR